ncbi:MAG: hypothetical protein K8S20_03775 [Chloroflexi bacterium]|nr:hypothetical protein [Chloroflexota bacterium]
MKKRSQRDEAASMIFGLSDKSVGFRNRWRILAGLALWLILSGFSMILTLFGVQKQLHVAVIIGLSFLKYIPLFFIAYRLARRMAAVYLDDVYELGNDALAAEFLENVAFGYGKEKITIDDGRIKKEDETSPLILIGGPGSIQVNLDSVALLEKVTGEPKVIHPRTEEWKLGRFERLREIGNKDEAGKREYAIINLRDQFVSGITVKSRTKDGIPIEAQDIKVIFSLLRKPQPEEDRVQGEAYQFDESAVRRLVYNQTIITPAPAVQTGIGFPWDTTAIPLVVTELEQLITSHTLSEILASISQKEIDNLSTADQNLTKMRVELTGHQAAAGSQNEPAAPNFESRTKITARFFDANFREKAARTGISIEWIDIGTWQFPNSQQVLEKHKEAWNLSRENIKKQAAVDRSRKQHEMEEIVKLVDEVIVKSFQSGPSVPRRMTEKEVAALMNANPELATNSELARKLFQRETTGKDSRSVAQEMLNAFRKELRAAKQIIEQDGRPAHEKVGELAHIEKALFDISYLTNHWI